MLDLVLMEFLEVDLLALPSSSFLVAYLLLFFLFRWVFRFLFVYGVCWPRGIGEKREKNVLLSILAFLLFNYFFLFLSFLGLAESLALWGGKYFCFLLFPFCQVLQQLSRFNKCLSLLHTIWLSLPIISCLTIAKTTHFPSLFSPLFLAERWPLETSLGFFWKPSSLLTR